MWVPSAWSWTTGANVPFRARRWRRHRKHSSACGDSPGTNPVQRVTTSIRREVPCSYIRSWNTEAAVIIDAAAPSFEQVARVTVTWATTPSSSWPNWSYGRQRPWATPRGPFSIRKSAPSCVRWRPDLKSRRIARTTPGEIGWLTPAQACCLPSAWQRCSCFQLICPSRVADPSRSTRPHQHCKVPRPRPRRVSIILVVASGWPF